MARHIFLLISAAFIIISLPENYSSCITQYGTQLVSSLFATSPSQGPQPENTAWTEWTKISEKELADVIDYSARVIGEKYPSIVAQVTFQTSSPWSHVLWIDKGMKTADLPFPIVRNAPVLIGSTLIGIVDFVGNHASRVRLLSDPAMHPAVRVVRGGYMTRHVLFMAQELQRKLQEHPSLMPNEALSQKLSALLGILSEHVQIEVDCRLAKGELQGCESPETPFLLRGAGFNYQYSDEDGSKRDLRTGQPEGHEEATPLIRPGDILETSGLDGFFPKGLEVATVTKVFPLEEGAICYNILAQSLAPEPSSPEYVTIIPAMGDEPFYPQTIGDKILTLIQDYSREEKKDS